MLWLVKNDAHPLKALQKIDPDRVYAGCNLLEHGPEVGLLLGIIEQFFGHILNVCDFNEFNKSKTKYPNDYCGREIIFLADRLLLFSSL